MQMIARHLLYFITPKENWKWNLSLLKKHSSVFNGHKIAVVACGDGLVDAATATKDIANLKIFTEVHLIKNDPELRETPGLKFLLERLEEHLQDEEGIATNHIFFAHTKGVTRKDNDAVNLWTEACYDKNLSDIDKVTKTLTSNYNTVGSFRRFGKFPHIPGCDWHFSGTFWWANALQLYGRDWKSAIKPHRYGAEGFISNLFPKEESECLFADKCGDLYNLAYTKSLMSNDTSVKSKKSGE